MPRRSLGQGAKPFEVKVGVGFPAFGGMYRLGDPSMCPPNRYRRLVNVRLGDKDVVSRPGLTAQWSGASDPVLGMSEILKRDAGKLWWVSGWIGEVPGVWGQDWQVVGGDYGQTHQYGVLFVDQLWPLAAYADDPVKTGQTWAFYLLEKQKQQNLTDQEITNNDRLTLAPVGHAPYVHIRGVANVALFPNFAGYDGSRHSLTGTSATYSGAATHNLERYHFVEFTNASHPALGPIGDWIGHYNDECNWGNVLDPPLYFQGKWIAPGGINPVTNPGVLKGLASGAPGTGQQMFELAFNTELHAPTPPYLRQLIDTQSPLAGYAEDGSDNFFGGSLTELFRMPGVTITGPTDRSSGGGFDGKTIRSMCVRSIRGDNPITAAQVVSEKLYIGTFGGYPLSPGYWKVVDVERAQPCHNLTDGDVYSWDGITLRHEIGSLGPLVTVITLPDGSVLACGRTAAALLDATDETWKPVVYDPIYHSLPILGSFSPAAPRAEALNPNPDYRSKGFWWTDRIIFRGEAYFVGFDTARLAANGTNGSVVVPQTDFPLLPPGELAQYQPSLDAWVLYKFDRGSMKMIKVRDGLDIWDALHVPGNPGIPPIIPALEVPHLAIEAPTLGVWNDELFYSYGFESGLGSSYPLYWVHLPDASFGPWWGAGKYDGSTFDDDALWLDVYTILSAIPVQKWSPCYDMHGAALGLYVTRPVYVTQPRDAIYRWDGTSLSQLIVGFGPHTRLFSGPR